MVFARALSVGIAVLVAATSAQAQTFQGLDLSSKPKKKAKTATLAVKLTNDLKGATLLIDGQAVGPLPLDEPQSLTTGEHVVRVEHLGYAAKEQKVTLSKGPNEVSVTLEPDSGIFTIDANEAGTVVSIDGASDEPLPVTKALTPGRHQLRFSKTGFIEEVRAVEARAGEEVALSAELKPFSDRPAKASLEPSEHDTDLEAERGAVPGVSKEGPIYTKWYLWAGVAAAVVAAGVAVAIVTSNQRPPLDPNTICSGRPCDATIGVPVGALPITP